VSPRPVAVRVYAWVHGLTRVVLNCVTPEIRLLCDEAAAPVTMRYVKRRRANSCSVLVVVESLLPLLLFF
jgi:hypothetical protein